MARFEVPEGWCVQAFRFTLDPTEDQARALARHFGARRTAYNWTVATLKTDIEAWRAGVTARFAAAAPDVVDTQQQAREYRCSCCRRCSPPHAEPGTW
ncbi:MAG: helix-turn-helix domain-containing protein, partial [Mycobacterium sp.]